ncbi:ParB/RepB/Spo0J family partition protein [bacterium]|nr:ParB/RepB/Spo0J family partition protein [bacterium]
MTKRVLGKGIDAIIPSEIKTLFGEKTLLHVSIEQIFPSPLQPRKTFDEDAVESLAVSIKEQGLLQPLLLRKVDDKYELVAGERRWRASKLAGLKTVPAIVVEADTPQKALFLSLVENLQREDLNPLEEAEAYHLLAHKFKLKQEEIAQQVGKSRPAVANIMRLLKLPDKIKEMLKDGKLTEGHARALLSIEDESFQMRLANLICRRGLSVERTEILARGEKESRKRVAVKGVDPEIIVLEKQLQLSLGTKVTIRNVARGGTIVIKYNSPEELYRISNLIYHEE